MEGGLEVTGTTGSSMGGWGPVGWGPLRQLWATLPEPVWDQERADRVFRNIMQALERRRRRRRLFAAACVLLPVVLLVTVRALRA